MKHNDALDLSEKSGENPSIAWVAELVDARDLKSLEGHPSCGFNSRPRHLKIKSFSFLRISVLFGMLQICTTPVHPFNLTGNKKPGLLRNRGS
jgi:hypothetical protein